MTSGAPVRRHFVTVGARQVHYRRCGDGPPLVLLHESPLSSRTYMPLLGPLAESFTAIALDTPGYGSSDLLQTPQPTIGDFADGVLETLDALGLAACGVYGFHTGALVALEVARRAPDRIVGGVLDGLPLYTEAESSDMLANYIPPFPADWTGSHMATLWTRFREQYVFWPWFRIDDDARLEIAVPDPATLTEGVLEMLESGDAYRLGPHAAFSYRVHPALAELTVPVAVLRRDNELFDHIDRLSELPPRSVVERVSSAPDVLARHVAAFFDTLGLDGPAPDAPVPAPLQGRTTKAYANTSDGQLLVRTTGGGGRRPLVVLHGSPAAIARPRPLFRPLEGDRPVLAFDLLGDGGSDAPASAEPSIEDQARALVEALDQLDLGEIDLYGAHTGALVALETAILEPERVKTLVLDGLPPIEDVDRAPSLAARADGTHLLAAWHFVKDQHLFSRWGDTSREAIRRAPIPAVETLSEEVLDLLRCADTYRLGLDAAARYDVGSRAQLVRVRTLVCVRPEQTALTGPTLVPSATTIELSDTPATSGDQIATFLEEQ